jgi:hypothetical protein
MLSWPKMLPYGMRKIDFSDFQSTSTLLSGRFLLYA